MKISSGSFQILHDAVKKAQRDSGIALAQYKEAGLSEKRYRWDLLYYAASRKAGTLPQHWICDVLYRKEDLNDNHIDTALRKITQQ